MGKTSKKIDVKDGYIVYNKVRAYVEGTYINYRILNENRKVEKVLSFNMWDDFSFSGTIYNEEKLDKIDEMKELEFVIDKENLMYNPLKQLLGEEKQFLLDDDNSYETNKKTMQIVAEEENIKVIFKNGKEEKELFDEKFKVFIKNILHDGRSKLSREKDGDTKGRLINLFKEFDVSLVPKETLEGFIMPEFEIGINNLDYYKETIFEIIPELKKADGFEHKHPHHCYDVWEHTIKALQKSNPDLQIRLALLLHDIGKPHSYWEGEDGVRHFPGHPEKSAQMSREILTRLGYTDKEIEDICYLVEYHDTIIDVDNLQTNNIELIKKQLHMQYCDAYAHDPKHIAKRIKKLDEIKEKLEEKINKRIEVEEER